MVVYLSSLLLLVWATLVFADLKPAHYPDYRRAVVQVAESAHDAARTGWLAGTEALSGHVFATFTSTAFDDATKALAGASDRFASEAPPDARSRRLRDHSARCWHTPNPESSSLRTFDGPGWGM
jgi:hypothetical protein